MIHLSDLERFDIVIGLINNIGEVCRTVELAVLEGLLIALNDLFDSIDTWVEDITIECKAVGASVIVGRDGATKPIQVDHFVTVVELQDVANGSYRLQVLVSLRIEEMERVILTRVTIG